MWKRPSTLKAYWMPLLIIFISVMSLTLLFWQLNDASASNLIVANNTYSIPVQTQTNTESGLLRHYVSPEVEHTVQSLAWGDMDGDGDLDLAVGNRRGQRNYIYENDGKGNFSAHNLSEARNNTYSLAWGDMDGDGDLDLAVGNAGHWDGTCLCFDQIGARNELYRNDGFVDGEIKFTPLPLGTDAKHTLSIAWGDINEDGMLDLVVGNWGEVNQIYENKNGKFELVPGDLIGSDKSHTASLSLGDVDGDGDLDLAVGNGGWSKDSNCDCYPKEVNYLYRNTTENGSIDFEGIPLGGDEKLTASVAWGDMEGDGDLDLAVGNWGQPLGGGDVNQIYRNDGTGAFNEEEILVINDLKNTRSVTWGDIDGDGDLDLAVANEHGNGGGQADQIYRYDKEGEQFAIVDIDRELGQSETTSVGWGDMDGDGDLDLAVGSQFGGTLFVYQNVRAAYLESSFLDENGSHTESAAWGDIDNDGDLDLAVGSLNAANYIYQNDGRGNFTPYELPDSKPARSLAWGDMNGDGYLDLAVGTGGEAEVNQVYLNVGKDGLINFEVVDDALGSDAQDSFSIVWGDMDGDGDLDLAVGNNNATNQLFENIDGNGHFELVLGALGEDIDWTHSVAWGDMDGDGDLDLAVGNWQGSPGDRVFVNDGKGKFSIIDLDAVSRGAEDVAWGDMDRDGDLDLAVANRFHTNVVYRNEGQGRFVSLILDNLTMDSKSVAWGDADGDGDLDLAVGNYRGDQLFINDGEGSFSAIDLAHQAQDSRTSDIAWGDVDGDGDLDLAVGTVDRNLILKNHTQMTTSMPGSIPFVSIGVPVTPTADFYALPKILKSRIISIPFKAYGAEGSRIHGLRAEYSLDGGGLWHPALTVTNSKLITTNLAVSAWPTGTEYVYEWDTFRSRFFGRSDNVVFRITALAQTPATSNSVTGTYRYTNSVAGSFQRPFASATTYPFRVQGTQIQVFSETISVGNEVVNASAFLLREDNFRAQLMGSAAANRPFVTDDNGFLSGRGFIQADAQLFAAVPITEAYRIPPQLIFEERGGQILIEPIAAPLTFTAEFWVHPTTNTGTVVEINDKDFILSYKTLSETTTISLVIGDELFTTTELPLNNGQAHHLAFNWSPADKQLILYGDGRQLISDILSVSDEIGAQINKIVFGSDFEGAMDEIRLWQTIRTAAEIKATLQPTNQPFSASGTHLLTEHLAYKEDLIGYWPIQQDDGGTIKDWSNHGKDAQVIDKDSGGSGSIYVGYKPLFTIYHTSAAVTETIAFLPVAPGGGVQQLIVSKHNPLILFDLDVSLEWDARNDPIFLQDLEASFVRASALLYDVTNGQGALGQINLYHNKVHWGASDVVIYADNSLRPSAAIGGVVNHPVTDTIQITSTRSITAYFPGQIRMGTSWDPYGETTTDLGEDWTRALAHELSHYLLFLPDNYLGIDEDGRFNKVNCQGSFMTTTSDPQYSEFLANAEWAKDADCQDTFASKLTGRADWETILKFYPSLFAPTQTIAGPVDLPLAVTYLIPWVRKDETTPYPARNFDIRDEDSEPWRLPNAQAFLIKAYDPMTTTDDVLIPLGNPTGGGDRLKVRGAEAGDRLCVFDNSGTEHDTGCIDALTANDAAMTMITSTNQLQPIIEARSIDAYTVQITVTLSEGKKFDNELNVQLFPLHYGSIMGNAPHITMTEGVSERIELKLPAYEIAVHVWSESNFANIQESITFVRLNPKTWELKNNVYELYDNTSLKPLVYSPIVAGPDTSIIGGPDTSIIGGPDTSIIGGMGRTLLGGPDTSIIGGPDTSIIGGPDTSIIGGPDTSIIGGGTGVASAPILSADAQVVIYDKENLFADNGVTSIQALPNFPEQASHPWLFPVGQAYRVELKENNQDRFISFTYLQRDVPDGYEDTLKIYFLEDGGDVWQPVSDTKGFVENLIVATLQPDDGVYAVVSTIEMPSLQEGWNLLSYPLLVSRSVTASLQSIFTAVPITQVIVHKPSSTEVVHTKTVTNAVVNVHSINIRPHPTTLNSPSLGYLLKGNRVTVTGLSNTGWLKIECPIGLNNEACWITANPFYVKVEAGQDINSIEGLVPPEDPNNSNRPEFFEFGEVYWIYIEKIVNNQHCTLNKPVQNCVDLLFAPPQVGPDGIIR